MACRPLNASTSGLAFAACSIERKCTSHAPEGTPCFAAPWFLTMLVLYTPVIALMAWNTRYQFCIMERMRQEKPLDDLIHNLSPLWMTENWFRRHTDTVVFNLPIVVLGLAKYGSSMDSWRTWMIMQARVPMFLLEFGAFALYKQIVCISTRLSPATQSDNVRINSLGISMSTWIDYGISGHTGLTVLLWLHLRTWPSLFLAIGQSVLMCVTREHYTLDVLHAWVFSFAIFGVFDAIVLVGQ